MSFFKGYEWYHWLFYFGLIAVVSSCTSEAYASPTVGHNTVLLCKNVDMDAQDIELLATNIYFEERTRLANDTITDLEAAQMGFVVLNRVNNPFYPDTVGSVIYQRKQFSWTHDGKSDRMRVVHARTRAYQIATMIVYGTVENLVGDATHYLNKNVSKAQWWKSMEFRGKFGSHWFYKEYR